MEATTSLVTDNEFFSAERRDRVLVVRGKPHFTRHAGDLKKIDAFFDHLEIIARTDEVGVVAFIGSPEKSGADDTLEFFEALLGSRREDYLLQRLLNLVNNYALTMAGLNKLTINADCGRISLFHLSMSLACDYRIVPRDKLEQTTLDMADNYQEEQVAAMLAVRRLLKSDVNELRGSLETEDMLLLNRVNSPAFRKVLEARAAARGR